MKLKWRSGFQPELVLAKIEATRTFGDGGRAQFNAFVLAEYEPVLQTMLLLPKGKAHGIDMPYLIRRTLAHLPSPISSSEFINVANELLKEVNAVRETEYHILTTISMKRACLPASVKWENSTIRFLRGDFPAKYKSRNTQISKHPLSVSPSDPDHVRVITTVMSKSPSGAFDAALKAIDLVRAVCGVICNPRMQLVFGHAQHRPINVIRLGEFHTIHKPDGDVIDGHMWFEPRYIEAKAYDSQSPESVKRQVKKLLARINSVPYKETLVTALTRYAGAMDEADFDTAFLRLWSATEGLAAPPNSTQDAVVRRCAFLWKEPELHAEIMKHLRSYRNSSVHESEYHDNSRLFCLQLQRYLTELMHFHMNHGPKFGSLDRANDFLDSAWNIGTLEQQIARAKRAIKWRG